MDNIRVNNDHEYWICMFGVTRTYIRLLFDEYNDDGIISSTNTILSGVVNVCERSYG